MNNRYLYDMVYRNILKDIENGVYKPGDKLPTEKELSKQYNVSRITSQRAMKELVEHNIIQRQAGLGSFLSKSALSEIQKIKPLSEPSAVIGLLVESIWPSYGVDLFNATYEKALEYGYHLVVKMSYGHQDLELKSMNELINFGAKGILLMPVHGANYNEKLLQLVKESYPVILLDRYLKGIPLPYVGTNNTQGVFDAFNYLKSIGHESIGYITSEEGQITTIDERKQGYIKACIENNSKIYLYENSKCIILSNYDSSENDTLVKKIQDYIIKNPEVSAYITSEHYSATLLKLATRNLGLRVPEDINIICFDAPENYADIYEYTHIKQNETQIGHLAVDILQDIINGTLREDKIFVDTSIILGDSTSNKQ